MIRPDPLQKGDTIAIIAPARKLNADDLIFATDKLQSWGLNVIHSKNILSQKHSYLAGTDQERLDDFQAMLDDPEVKAIICARGGYGSTRLIDKLNFSSFAKRPKWIVGFSDITAVHLCISQKGYQSIHGIMPVLFAKPDSRSSVESLQQVLFGVDQPLTAPYFRSNRIGTAQGETIGGNLSLIVESLGTSSELDYQKKILIVEEIDEYLYKIDRMFTQLKRAGKLSALAGLAIGHFTDIKDTTLSFGQNVEEIILEVTKDYAYPVAFGFQTGHQNPNVAWRHGAMASLVADTHGSEITFTSV